MSGSSTAPAGDFPGEIEGLLKHGTWLRRLAASLLGSDEGAQDLVQETWIAAVSSPAPGGVDSRSWLAGITRNLARNSRRKEARRRAHELARESRRSAPGADEDAADLEQQRRLVTALLAIPEGQRRAVVARFYDGLPPRTIAAREGVPVATIKSQIQRGLGALRGELDEAYGSRRAWAVAFAPMALKVTPIGSAAGISAGTGVFGAKLFAALAAAIAAVIFAVSREASQPAPGALQESESVAVVLAPELASPGLVAATDESLMDPVSSRATQGRSSGDAAATEPRLRVIARARETGRQIPTFEGWAARMAPIMEALSKSGARIDSLDQIAAFGEPIEWNSGGRAFVRNSAGLFVYVASGDRAGVGMRDELDEEARELDVDLVHAPPLWVRLVDRAGKRVEHDALIKFEALLPKSGSGLLTAEGILENSADHDWQRQAVSLTGGAGQCRLVMNMMNRDQPFEGLRAVQTRSFHYDAPGVLEFAGDEIAFADPPLKPVPLGRREVKVLMPELGALEVSVVDAAGARLPVSGTASFQFRSVPSGLRTRTFEAVLEEGNARWPEVLAASQEVRVTLSVPSLGQTWSVSGIGPAADGATSQIKTQVPEASTIRARLLGADGVPLANRVARLVHGDRSFFAAVRFTSDSDGRICFALPDGGIQDGSLLLEVFDDREVVGFQLISVPAETRLAGGDAGDWSVRFPAPAVIHGRLEDLDGQPHPRAYVTLTRGGRVAVRDLVGKQGEFRFKGVFGEDTILAVRLLRPDEKPLTANFSRQPDAEVTVRPYEDTGPVVVRLGPPKLGASVHARVDLNSFELVPGDVGLSVEAADPFLRKELLWDASAQEYRALDVPEGIYSAYLRIRTSGALVSWTDIEVGASGEVRDPRLYGISLAEHLRPVKVSWKDPVDPETGQRRPFLSTEYHRVFEDPRRVEGALITSGDAWPQLVLRRRDGVLRVGAPGYRTVQFPIEDVGETVEVELGLGIPVDVTLVGDAPRGAKFGLYFVREVTTSIHVEESGGSYVPVPDGLVGGDSWQARLPKAGRYRLRRHTGSPMNPPQSLDAWLMVEEPVAGGAVQEAVLNLAAPAAVTMEAIGR